MERIREVLEGRENNYIMPFFWQHGENESILRDYMRQINSAGIKAVCIESRPHPDFIGSLWWRDMDIIMEEAKNLEMKVWVLDDSHFPTGFAAGKIKSDYPELRKWYLNAHRIDVKGPLKDSSFIVKYFQGRAALMPGYKKEDEFIGVVVGKVLDTDTMKIDEETLLDVTEYVQDGALYWDLPEGAWSIFVVYKTRNGGEEQTKDYLNPLVKEATKVLIDTVYEAHYERYKKDFGNTFAGFFSDEPRLGNIKGFEGALGKTKMVLPWSNEMTSLMEKEIGDNPLKLLPLLFAEGNEKMFKVRYTYMDIVSRLYGENFTSQLGNWCREHKVEYIGHVIEDNGSHARLGYGAGHFFRALNGQDMSGIDVIGGQIVPGMDFYHDGFSSSGWNGEFFHYGLAKLGVSLAHLDAKKKGRTMCELFGAYGWVEGLKFMKWLTDHLLVRGVNNFVPHAFSPKAFPDWDCPPHFYAGGNDPQFKYMKIWSDYTNRMSHLLSGGKHIAPVAVLYHAEAEWSGKYMPFEKIVKKLTQNQIDCDVIPADVFRNEVTVQDGNIKLNNEQYKCLVVPYSEALPKYFLDGIYECMKEGFEVIFIDSLPNRCSENIDASKTIKNIEENNNFMVVNSELLIDLLRNTKAYEIEISGFQPYLTYYHYEQENTHIFMFFNEAPYDSVDTKVYIPINKKAVCYDAFENKLKSCKIEANNNGIEMELKLSPYESKVIILSDEEFNEIPLYKEAEEVKVIDISGKWKISMAETLNYPNFKNIDMDKLINLARRDLYPDFSGTVRYEASFEVSEIKKNALLDLGKVYEIADVKLNGESIGVKIAPPYIFDISEKMKIGTNNLVIEVTNTLAKSQKDFFSQFAVQEPTGLIGPVLIKSF